MNEDDAIALLQTILNTSASAVQLNDTQARVFRLIWVGEPYREIANITGYDYDYIKQVSAKLWQLLSQALNQSVSRRNLQTVFQQCAQQACAVTAWHPDPEPEILHNLPVANYSTLVGREAETVQLLEYLDAGHPAHCISIEGLGGIGKTTLALSIGYRFLQPPAAFHAIVFISAKAVRLTAAGILPRLRPDRNLRDIFRAIAYTLRCPEILLQPFEEQLTQIQVHLSRQRTLLLIDNLETVEDWQPILAFLYDLPLTVKVLLTSRQQTPFPSITLAPLAESESVSLIQNQFRSKGLDLDSTMIHDLYRQTCGVPAAMVYAVGLIASGYSIAASSIATGDYAQFYLESSILLAKNSDLHRLFMAFALFPDAAVREAIAAVADIADTQVMQGLAKLQQLSLIHQQAGRYEMLPLTREYAIAELNAQPEFKALAYSRWVQWYLAFASTHGGQDWRDWQNYKAIEQEWNNLQDVIEWCIANDCYTEVSLFWQKIRSYSYAQGHRRNRLTCWVTHLGWTEWLVQAAELLQDWSTAAAVLLDKAWTLTLLGQAHHLDLAESLFWKAWNYRDKTDLSFQIELAIHIAVWHIQKQQFSEASRWLQDASMLFDQTRPVDRVDQRLWIQWHYYQGEIDYKTGNDQQAQHHFQQVLEQAQRQHWQRAIFLAKGWLADIALKQQDLPRARLLLKEGLQVAREQGDRCRLAYCMRSLARLEKLQGNPALAYHWAGNARQVFEQLGMVIEAQETTDLLQQLS